MKKSLLALAVLGAFSGAASAQTTNITVYGIVDANIARTSVNSNRGNLGVNSGSKWLLDEGNNGSGRNGSRLGFKGSEDLGGGLSGIFQLESGFAVDTGVSTQSGRLFGRQAYVGLSSKAIGAFTLGRQYTVMHIGLDSIDPFGTGMAGNIEGGFSAATGSNAVPANTLTAPTLVAGTAQPILTPTVAAGASVTLFNAYGVRFDNTVQYATPNFSGLTATVQYSFGEAAGSFSPNQAYGASVDYNNGPIHVVGVYQQAKPLITTATQASPTTPFTGQYSNRGYMIGGTHDFHVAKLHLAYGQDKFDNKTAGIKTVDARNGMIGVSAPIGAFTVMGSFVAQDDRTALDGDHQQFALGAIYDLSKRTNIYSSAGYLRGRKGASNANANLFQVGLQHRF